MSSHLDLTAIKEKIGCKVYYDDDPGFTQFWHARPIRNPALGSRFLFHHWSEHRQSRLPNPDR